jgi:hypothetical protein
LETPSTGLSPLRWPEAFAQSNTVRIRCNTRRAVYFIRWLYELLDGRYFMVHGDFPDLGDLAIDVAGCAVGKSQVYFSYYRFFSFIDRTRPEVNSQFFRTLKQALPGIREKWGKLS